MAEPVLQIRDLYKSFDSTPVLSGVSLDVYPGETLVVIGPSGTGKSTLLRCVNRLTPPDSGEVILDGELVDPPRTDMTRIRQQVGMVFQDFNLFHHLNALNNVTVGLTRVKKMPRQRAAEKAMQELTRVGLADKARNYPAELSGGQKQRVAIARALALDPKIMMFDEPTSALDPELIGEVLRVMKGLAEAGMTMIVVSHELGFAREAANRILFMEHGVIQEEGPPEQVFNRPHQARTREFINKLMQFHTGEGQRQEDAV